MLPHNKVLQVVFIFYHSTGTKFIDACNTFYQSKHKIHSNKLIQQKNPLNMKICNFLVEVNKRKKNHKNIFWCDNYRFWCVTYNTLYSFCLNFFHLLAGKPNSNLFSIYSNKFFHNFLLSESSFTHYKGLKTLEIIFIMFFFHIVDIDMFWKFNLLTTSKIDTLLEKEVSFF